MGMKIKKIFETTTQMMIHLNAFPSGQLLKLHLLLPFCTSQTPMPSSWSTISFPKGKGRSVPQEKIPKWIFPKFPDFWKVFQLTEGRTALDTYPSSLQTKKNDFGRFPMGFLFPGHHVWDPWQVFRREHPKRRTPGGIGWWPSGLNDVFVAIRRPQATRKAGPCLSDLCVGPSADRSIRAKAKSLRKGGWYMKDAEGHWKLSPSPGPLMSNRSRSPWSLADLWFGIKPGFGLEGNKEPAPLSPLRGAPHIWCFSSCFQFCWYCWWFRNPANQLNMVNIPSFTRFHIHVVWFAGFLNQQQYQWWKSHLPPRKSQGGDMRKNTHI